MISDFKNFPIMLLRQPNFGELSVYAISHLLQRKNATFSSSAVFVVGYWKGVEP